MFKKQILTDTACLYPCVLFFIPVRFFLKHCFICSNGWAAPGELFGFCLFFFYECCQLYPSAWVFKYSPVSPWSFAESSPVFHISLCTSFLLTYCFVLLVCHLKIWINIPFVGFLHTSPMNLVGFLLQPVAFCSSISLMIKAFCFYTYIPCFVYIWILILQCGPSSHTKSTS